MRAFTSTIDTVFEMIISLCVRSIDTVVRAYNPPREVLIEAEKLSAEVFSKQEAEDAVLTPQTFKPLHKILRTEGYADVSTEKRVVMYANTVSVPVYKNPTVAFDERIGTIPYGEMVMMLEPRGRFFHIVWNTLEGWVLREDLVDRAAHVYPEFTIGQEYGVDHPTTASVRTILGDIFGLARSEFPLQAGEYVLYRLWRRGIRIEWPSVRPRVPGLWHKILKGVPKVHSGVTPRVGSIMEYVFEGDVGHLAYVEAVFPDNTITISEVNYPDSGIYNERVLTKEEWREFRPVFITIQ